MELRNWAGNIRFSTDRVHHPETVGQVQEIVRNNVKQLLPRIEERLGPFDARPHWGKLFTIPAPTLQASYERLPDFRALLESFDPKGTFRNAFLETFVFG